MSGNIEERLRELGQLPELAPPAALEPRVLAAMAAAAVPGRSGAVARAAVWGGILLLAGLLAAVFSPSGRDDAAAPRTADVDETYRELVEQSAYLEGLLMELPQREVMSISTAGTIAGLEERIALIDAALAERDEVAPEYRTTLMRDRIDTMNALVSVRYAQSRAFMF